MQFPPRHFRQALKLLLSAALLAAVLLWVDLRALFARLAGVEALPLVAAMGLNLAAVALNAAKIRALFPPPRPALPGIVKLNFTSIFIGTFVPGGIGGEVARWAYLARETGSRSLSLGAILLDRLSGLWTQLLFAAVAWVGLRRAESGLPAALAAYGAALVLLAAALGAGLRGYRGAVRALRRLGEWYARRSGGTTDVTEGMEGALADLLSDRRRLLAVAGISLAYQALILALFLLIDRSIGGGISWRHAALFLFCYTVLQMAPLAPGNLGFAEGVLGALYLYAGEGSETGVLISLLMRVMALPAAALGWLFFLARRPGPPDRGLGPAA